MDALRFDLFCRVIDNHGDVGVCWRLAADLAARGRRVRLWIDDASALPWMAPDGAAGVTVLPWPAEAEGVEPGDVVVEAFGCELPPGYIAAMAARRQPPVWIDLEYLSAESYVERSHGIASPQMAGPGRGLAKWFFYPGFTARTGGLIREAGLLARREAFDRDAWLRGHGLARRRGERVVSIFCYAQPALPALLAELARTDAPPTMVVLTHGHASRQGAACLDAAGTEQPAGLRVVALPHLSQTDYDHLLWSCDLNFVRGEDSFVRAQWAGAPFVWQIYPQDDAAHLVKLQAFLRLHLAGAEPGLSPRIERLWAVWNGTAPPAAIDLPPLDAWQRACAVWRDSLLVQSDLATQLLDFVREKG